MAQKEIATEAQSHREDDKIFGFSQFFCLLLCGSVPLWPISCPNVVRFGLDRQSNCSPRSRTQFLSLSLGYLAVIEAIAFAHK